MDNFKKVVIGSGLMAEMVLCTLIWHKGESPKDFCIVGEDIKRSFEIMKKYNIPVTTNLPEFVAESKVVVLAFDIDDIDKIPATIEDIKPFVQPSTLINSFTPKLRIEDIEGYFPENPVMRLGINLSSISGNGTGVFCTGSKNKASTDTVARFLIEYFGDLIEVEDEEEMETVWDAIYAISCSCYLAMNCFFNSGIKLGINPEKAKEIVISVFKGAAETMGDMKHEDLVFRSFKYEKVFRGALEMLKTKGIGEEMHKTMMGSAEGLNFNRMIDTKIHVKK